LRLNLSRGRCEPMTTGTPPVVSQPRSFRALFVLGVVGDTHVW
jgi:hypothetical protein